MSTIPLSATASMYAVEAGSREVKALIGEAQEIGTGATHRAEASAALAKEARGRLVAREAAGRALQAFNTDWEHLV